VAFLRRGLESVCGLGWWGGGCAGRREAKKMGIERGGEETRDWMGMAHVMCLFSTYLSSVALQILWETCMVRLGICFCGFWAGGGRCEGLAT
jgi:hypothetical protein